MMNEMNSRTLRPNLHGVFVRLQNSSTNRLVAGDGDDDVSATFTVKL